MTPLHKDLLAVLRRSGPMPFSRYMQLCLYHPEFGYYMQERERTGVAGDYFTSADLHPIFSRLLARQAVEMWDLLGRPAKFTWVEMGFGRGLLARDFLRFAAKTFPEFSASLDYVAIEPAARRREQLLKRAGDENFRLRCGESLEGLDAIEGCFFSNELVDAFPVSVVTRDGGKLKEVYVTAEGDTLREKLGPLSDSAIAAAITSYANQLDEGARAEVSLAASQWMRAVAGKLARGFVLTIDYGDRAARLYTLSRARGTLLAYKRHSTSEDFFAAPGEQDLTAHVNFGALIDSGREAGLEYTGMTTQEKFLMAMGEATEFSDLYDDGQTEVERLDARLKLKRLIYPGDADGPAGMGAIFKVLIQHRGLNAPKLTGLKFEG